MMSTFGSKHLSHKSLLSPASQIKQIKSTNNTFKSKLKESFQKSDREYILQRLDKID